MSNPSGSTATGTRCAACRYLRRRCSQECVLAPYFPASHPDRFACVHRIFGASNVSRMLQRSRIPCLGCKKPMPKTGLFQMSEEQLPVNQRAMAADSISYEAYWRVRDPVYGTVGIISRLNQEVRVRQGELAKVRGLIAVHGAARASQAPFRGHFGAGESSNGGAAVLEEYGDAQSSCQQSLLTWDAQAAAALLQQQQQPPPPPM